MSPEERSEIAGKLIELSSIEWNVSPHEPTIGRPLAKLHTDADVAQAIVVAGESKATFVRGPGSSAAPAAPVTREVGKVSSQAQLQR